MAKDSIFISTKSAIKLAANALGAVAYMHFAMPLWAPEEFLNIPGSGGGEPIIWGLTAFPILVLFFLLNLYWLVSAGVTYYKTRRRELNLADVGGFAVWIISVNIDYSHHWSL